MDNYLQDVIEKGSFGDLQATREQIQNCFEKVRHRSSRSRRHQASPLVVSIFLFCSVIQTLICFLLLCFVTYIFYYYYHHHSGPLLHDGSSRPGGDQEEL